MAKYPRPGRSGVRVAASQPRRPHSTGSSCNCSSSSSSDDFKETIIGAGCVILGAAVGFWAYNAMTGDSDSSSDADGVVGKL